MSCKAGKQPRISREWSTLDARYSDQYEEKLPMLSRVLRKAVWNVDVQHGEITYTELPKLNPRLSSLLGWRYYLYIHDINIDALSNLLIFYKACNLCNVGNY